MFKYNSVYKRTDIVGSQFIFKFDNGYGASVVRHEFSHGSELGLWELAVISFYDDTVWSWNLCYDTEITDDVLGYLSIEEVNNTLDKIINL